MKLTESKLRRIIRGIVREERGLSENRNEIEKAVQNAIKKFKSDDGQMQWREASRDFEYMAEGDFIPGVSDEYYVGWTPEDFQAVIDGVEG